MFSFPPNLNGIAGFLIFNPIIQRAFFGFSLGEGNDKNDEEAGEVEENVSPRAVSVDNQVNDDVAVSDVDGSDQENEDGAGSDSGEENDKNNEEAGEVEEPAHRSRIRQLNEEEDDDDEFDSNLMAWANSVEATGDSNHQTDAPDAVSDVDASGDENEQVDSDAVSDGAASGDENDKNGDVAVSDQENEDGAGSDDGEENDENDEEASELEENVLPGADSVDSVVNSDVAVSNVDGSDNGVLENGEMEARTNELEDEDDAMDDQNVEDNQQEDAGASSDESVSWTCQVCDVIKSVLEPNKNRQVCKKCDDKVKYRYDKGLEKLKCIQRNGRNGLCKPIISCPGCLVARYVWWGHYPNSEKTDADKILNFERWLRHYPHQDPFNNQERQQRIREITD